LSEDLATAKNVGKRHGKLVILEIKAGELHRAGQAFFRSENEVWLTEKVEVAYINFPEY